MLVLPITNVDVIGDVIDDVMWSRNRLYILLVLRNSQIPIYAILVAETGAPAASWNLT